MNLILILTILCTLMHMVTSFEFGQFDTGSIDPALKDAYNELGITKSEDARKVYLKLARLYHPDNNIGNEGPSAEKFKIISNAYRVVEKSEQQILRTSTSSGPIQRTSTDSGPIQRTSTDSGPIQRTSTGSDLERTYSTSGNYDVAPSKFEMTLTNFKEGASNSGAIMSGIFIAGTIGNMIAPDTFQPIPLDVIGNQLMKTAITTTVVPNLCGNSIECNIVGAILTNTVMDNRFINNKKLEAVSEAKITLNEYIESTKYNQDNVYNKISPNVKADMEKLRDIVYDAMTGSNFMPKKIGKTELAISKNGAKVCEISVNSNYVISIFDIKSDYVIHIFRTHDGTNEIIKKQESVDVFPSSVIKSGSHISDVINQVHSTVEKSIKI